MITALIRVEHGPETLAVTLSALVPAVAAGLVGDAVILVRREDATLAAIADAAGASVIVSPDGAWHPGAPAARREWLLCLDDGDVPQEGWIRVLDRFVSLNSGQGLARLRREKGGAGRVLKDALGRLFGGSAIQAGDLVHRRLLENGIKAPAPVRLPVTIGRDPVLG